MDDLLINKTAITPLIDFRKSGQLKIQGKSLPENPQRFFTPLFNWADQLTSERVDIDVILEYINTSSSKNLMQLIKLIDKNPGIRHLYLNWHYESDDLEMLEFGELLANNLRRAKTSYIEYEDEE
ncbi:MAG TPA: DUF1987 domain-containing protein [Bacteroidales bacterium]|nr:DUF1987 domain-containing protein [Bacteroidales bacterium]